MNNFLLGQPWALKLVWAVNVQNYTILPGTLISEINFRLLDRSQVFLLGKTVGSCTDAPAGPIRRRCAARSRCVEGGHPTPSGPPRCAWSPCVTLPHKCGGLSTRRMAVVWTFREPFLGRQV